VKLLVLAEWRFLSLTGGTNNQFVYQKEKRGRKHRKWAFHADEASSACCTKGGGDVGDKEENRGRAMDSWDFFKGLILTSLKQTPRWKEEGGEHY